MGLEAQSGGLKSPEWCDLRLKVMGLETQIGGVRGSDLWD